jgi:hypothetical protein
MYMMKILQPRVAQQIIFPKVDKNQALFEYFLSQNLSFAPNIENKVTNYINLKNFLKIS